jgi:hypothetical protein
LVLYFASIENYHHIQGSYCPEVKYPYLQVEEVEIDACSLVTLSLEKCF